MKTNSVILIFLFLFTFGQGLAWNTPNINSPANGASVWTGVTFDWYSVSGSQQYQFQLDTAAGFSSPLLFSVIKNYINSSSGNSDTEQYMDNLLFGKNYYWRVRAWIPGDTSAWSAVRFVITRDYVTLNSPASGSSTWAGVNLDWNSHPGVDYYDFQADTSLLFNSPALVQTSKSYINSSSGNSDTEHYLSDIYFGTTYFWRVRARNAADTSEWSAVWNINTRDYVSLYSPASGSSTWAGVTLDWYSHPGVDYYDFQADTSLLFNSPILVQASKTYINSSSGNNDTEHYLQDVYFGATYYWRVRARNAADTSEWSAVWNINTRDYVSLYSPASGSSTWAGVTLDWYSHPGVDYYDLQADTSLLFNSPALVQASKTYINSSSGNVDTEHYLSDIYFGTTYFWRVRARNAADTSEWSAVWNINTRDYVSLYSPASGSSTWAGVTLDWYSHPGVDYYDLQADTSVLFNSPALVQASKTYINSSSGNSDTEHYLQDIFFGVKYYWRVRARNAADTSEWSSIWNINIRDYVTLVYPNDNQLNIPTSGVTLDWNSHPGIDIYQLQIDTTNLFNSQNLQEYNKYYINSSSNNNDTRHATGGLSPNTVYFWRVRAINGVDSSLWTTRAFSTGNLPILYPAIPQLLSPSNNAEYTDVNLAFNWLDANNALTYLLEMDTIPGFGTATAILCDTSGTEVVGLIFNQTYYWRVRAVREFIYSDWSEKFLFTTGLRPPQLVHPAAYSTNQPTDVLLFDWAPSERAVSYRFQLSQNYDFSNPLIDASFIQTDTIVSGLDPAKVYFWRTQASDGIYFSNWSNPREFTTEPQNAGFFLYLSLWLEGPYDGMEMDTDLNSGGLLPTSHPYSTAPWNVTEGFPLDSIPSGNVVDWILLEIRDAANASQAGPGTVVASQPAFLMNGGEVRAADGISLPQFNTTISHNLFLVIKHRNHIPVMSSQALPLAGNVYSWDFRTGSGQSFGGELGCREVSQGQWGLAGGDGNADAQVNNTDKNGVWATQAGASGYKAGDFSMDGQVNNTDKNGIWVPNTGMGSQVP